MHSAKCKLDWKRNDFADSQDFNMKLKTKPTGKIQISSQKTQSYRDLRLILKIFLPIIDLLAQFKFNMD